MTESKERLCDVLAVTIANSTVRIIAERKTHDNAEAIVEMAITRRGVATEYFTIVANGSYRETEKWEGQRSGLPPKTPSNPDYYRIGNMMYPNGKRGL